MKYAEIVNILDAAGIDDAAFEAGLLISRYAGIPRHELLFRRQEDFSVPALGEAVRRRAAREPLQYILGSWTFRGLEFELNADTLIPRPDTELTVGLAVRHLPRGARFADLGTGSGAIAVSVLHERPDTSAVAVEISENALAAAVRNAAAHGVADRLTPLRADLLAEGFSALLASAGQPDAILSNPPYIPTGELASLAPELAFEPRRALDGGNDGLIFYRSITQTAALLLPPGGILLYEVGIGEAADVAALGAAQGFSAEVYRDLAGIDRAVLLRKLPLASPHENRRQSANQ